MSKMKQIAALTAMLVGVVLYASPAKSAVCFLPDDDGSCGGGDIEISDNPTPENQCADFKLSKNQRDSKEYSSDCYTCESCTFNNRTTYRCSPKSGATWYGNLGVCCTNGETYDSAEGQCCPAGGCAHDCKAPKEWNSVERKCKCPNGKDADGDICCADSEYVSNGICCTTDKENVNGVCVCKQGTIPDGTGCKPDDSPKCNDINPHYYPISDTEKYDACSDEDSDVYDLRTLDVYGSDGQCFTCYHRTCKEIGESLDDYEPWYTSCNGYDIQIKQSYGPGSDGECYICRNYKDMLCQYIDSKYIGAKTSCTNEEYYKKTIVNGVVGKDGQCYTCNLRTCNDIDADWYNEDEPCPSDGYYYEKKTLRGKKGSDGQCYECEQLFTDIVFLLEQDAVDDLSCVDGYDRNNPFAISKRKVKWSSYLDSENLNYAGINSKTYTLPFDMKIVIKYKVPGVDCSSGDLFFDQKLEMGDPALVPRTVEIVIPAGSNLNYFNNDIEVVGYAGENIVKGQKTIMSIDYYIGDEKTKDLYIGNIHYGFWISSE